VLIKNCVLPDLTALIVLHHDNCSHGLEKPWLKIVWFS